MTRRLAAWSTVLVPAILRKSPNPAVVPPVLTVPAVVIGLYIFMVFCGRTPMPPAGG